MLRNLPLGKGKGQWTNTGGGSQGGRGDGLSALKGMGEGECGWCGDTVLTLRSSFQASPVLWPRQRETLLD